MEPHRGYASDGNGDQRWYEGDQWDRGRHGAPGTGQQESGLGANSTAYPEVRHSDTHERAAGYGFDEPDPRYAEPTSGATGTIGPRSGEPIPPLPGDESAEASRRSIETLDVGALRRPAVNPASDTSAYSGTGYGGSEYATPAGYPPQPSPFFGGSASGDYSPSYQADAGASSSDLDSPTSAVATSGPPLPKRPGVYQTRRRTIALLIAVVVVLLEVAPVRLLLSATLADPVLANGTVAGTFLIAAFPAAGYGLYALTGATKDAGWTDLIRPPLIFLGLGVALFFCAAVAA